jgi:hypothetical protein
MLEVVDCETFPPPLIFAELALILLIERLNVGFL